ncbi:MAG: KPN_02809 family neutral zinc metallopeptidase [Acidimicrobiales bacterium]
MKLDDVDADLSGFEDRRGQRGGGGGGLGGISLGRGGKVGLPAVVLLVVGVLFKVVAGGGGSGGFDITGALNQLGGAGTPAGSGAAPASPASSKDAQVKFVGQVRTLLNDYWSGSFTQSDKAFHKPGMVVFDAPTSTGCGVGQPEAGPFYCPADEKIYLDLGFYDKLQSQLGFSGDFAEAYVLAHEYGHHIQSLLGINKEVQDRTQGASEAEANRLSVKLELQADCFAGAWAKSAYADQKLSAGDLDEALGAASAVGDDAIQKQTQGRVDQESFTHGSSADRQKWFRTGYDTGQPDRCDTFG